MRRHFLVEGAPSSGDDLPGPCVQAGEVVQPGLIREPVACCTFPGEGLYGGVPGVAALEGGFIGLVVVVGKGDDAGLQAQQTDWRNLAPAVDARAKSRSRAVTVAPRAANMARRRESAAADMAAVDSSTCAPGAREAGGRVHLLFEQLAGEPLEHHGARGIVGGGREIEELRHDDAAMIDHERVRQREGGEI